MTRAALKGTVMQALDGVGVPVWYNARPAPVGAYPCITYSIYHDADDAHGDGAPIGRGYHIQVDVWGKQDPDALADDVRARLLRAGFCYQNGRDLYEDDQRLYHIAQRLYIYTEG